MRYVDVFNGDADGICALHQLRLAQPATAELVTGLKREIDLLERVQGVDASTEITVLDLSLARNRRALDEVLALGARVRWFDHHFAGDVPAHPGLEAHIDTAADVCSSLLVDRHLQGAYRLWAIVAAFGDNLIDVAQSLADAARIDAAEAAGLRALGAALNYNSYGDEPADVLIHPRDLYLRLQPYADPRDFAAREPIVAELIAQRTRDLALAQRLAPYAAGAASAVFVMPDLPWCRRAVGTWAHQLANDHPMRAHAVLKDNGDATYTVSVRAPVRASHRPRGADALCRQFGGGGRAGAAGIDRLSHGELESFVSAFRRMRWDADITLC